MRCITTASTSAFCLGLAIAASADCAVAYKHSTQNPAAACALSASNSDTKVRAKAAGFRNEGTTNAFVICGFDNTALVVEWPYFGLSGLPYVGFVKLEVDFSAFDGKTHDFSCTGAARYSPQSPLLYLTKQVSVDGDGGSVVFDVGDVGAGGYDLRSASQSITCVLPPGVAILSVASDYGDVDGTPMACSNGKDDDGDGLIDVSDPGCAGVVGYEPGDDNEIDDERGAKACSDSWDNDGDGRMDYPSDPQCSSFDDDSEMYF